jgi:glutathione peroxidase
MSFYDLSAEQLEGGEFDFRQLEGKVVLVVNTASKCGFTPQFEGLEKIYQDFKDDGLVVLGFPCNQFGSQDPGSASEIGEFCQRNYGVSFPMMAKVDVNGSDAHPVYQYLKKAQGGLLLDAIKWNFTKFLVNREGEVVERFGSITKPESLKSDIKKLL